MQVCQPDRLQGKVTEQGLGHKAAWIPFCSDVCIANREELIIIVILMSISFVFPYLSLVRSQIYSVYLSLDI